MPNNYAFIDGSNLHLTYEHLEWKIDYSKLNVYLRDKHSITKAYYFTGNYAPMLSLHLDLERIGYTLMLKDISHLRGGRIKGNCDAEIVLQAMIDKPFYDKAVIITSDGDFSCLVKHLKQCDKLERVIAPCLAGCSHLLKEASGNKIDFLDNAKHKIEYEHKSKKEPRKDQPLQRSSSS